MSEDEPTMEEVEKVLLFKPHIVTSETCLRNGCTKPTTTTGSLTQGRTARSAVQTCATTNTMKTITEKNVSTTRQNDTE